MEVALSVVGTLIAAAGVFLGISNYRLGSIQRDDLQLRTLRDLHEGFWNDNDMKIVRSWIANSREP